MRRVILTAVAALACMASPILGGGSAGAKLRPAITFAAVGDTMLGNAPELPARPGTYLDRVKGRLRGDVVFGNLEGTLTDVTSSPKCGGTSGGSCYAFRTPPSYARHLAAAGFTVMSDANNHSYDFGQAASTRRSPPCAKPASPRPACPARSPWWRREGRRSRSSASRPTR